MNKRSARAWRVLLAVALAGAAGCRRDGKQAVGPETDPLEAAWRFASAVTNDASDRAAGQEQVARAFLERGEIERALELGGTIGDWRRAVVQAEAGAALAEAGRTGEAESRLAEAAAVAQGIQDWQRDRILARVAKGRAFLGRESEAGETRAFYRTNKEYRGETAAYHALALARGGRVEEAERVLAELGDATDFDTAVWRAQAYLLLRRAGHLEGNRGLEALRQGWAAAERIPGMRRWEVRLELAEALGAGEGALAREWAGQLASNLLGQAVAAHLRAPLVGRLAGVWAGLGDAERVAESEVELDALIANLQAIEKPALLALAGEARARLGDFEGSRTRYGRAIEASAGLTNRRPRALACSAVCLSLERSGLPFGLVSEALNRLLTDLETPHE